MKQRVMLCLVLSALTACEGAQDAKRIAYGPEQILEDLQSGDRDLYDKALTHLRSNRSDYTPDIGDILLRDLDDPGSPADGSALIRTLGVCKEWRAVDWLLGQLADTEQENEEVIVALGRIGDTRARKPLTGELRRRVAVDGRLLRAYIRSLGLLSKDNEESLPLLLEFSRDKRAELRAGAALALGQTKSPKGVPRLAEMLKDKDRHVAVCAAAALGHIGSKETTTILVDEFRALSDRYWGGDPNKSDAVPKASRVVVAQELEDRLQSFSTCLAKTRRATALLAIMREFERYGKVDLRALFIDQEANSGVLKWHFRSFANLTGKDLVPDYILLARPARARNLWVYQNGIDLALQWWKENGARIKGAAARSEVLREAKPVDFLYDEF